LFLVPIQYSAAQTGGAWVTATRDSQLVPTMNSLFKRSVLDLVGFLFLDGVPLIYLNPVSRRVAILFWEPVRMSIVPLL
jgi:hypothetical protein